MKKIYLSVIACFFIALIMPFGYAEMTGVSSVSPSSNAWTNDTTPDFTFSAASNASATFSCSLYVDSASVATNGSTVNNTNTILTSTALAQGSHSWHVNCTDTNSLSSAARTIYIDTTAPTVALSSPSNKTDTSSHKMDFSFKTTDNLDSSTTCQLYVDGNDEGDNTEASNNSKETIENITLDADNHTWYVRCIDSAGNTGQSESWNLNVEAYCEEGTAGDVDIIKFYEPTSGKSFYVGESITVKVKVENNADDDLDIVVRAELYDEDDGDYAEYDEETVKIDKSESATITLNITVPSDVDLDDDFTVRVKASEEDNEEDQCDEDSVSVKIKKEDHSVVIDNVELEPETASCGSISYFRFDVSNVGDNDESTKMEIASPFLNWTYTSDLDKDDEAYNVNKPLEIPRNISEGNYTITAKVSYDYSSNTYRKSNYVTKTIKVQGNCQGPPAPDASLSATQTSDAFVGSSFIVKLKITNSGNVKSNYTIDASDYEDWATLGKIEPETIALEAGSTGYAYISLIPNENATGANSFKTTVTFGSTSKEQIVNVEIKKPTEPASSFDQFMFEMKRNWQWFALIALLIVVVVILAILLARQGRYHARQRRFDRFEPAEIRIRTAKDLKDMKRPKNGRVVRNF